MAEDVNAWDEARVVAWVQDLGKDFVGCAPQFKSNNITGRRLLKLTDDKLLKMGVTSLGVRDDLVEEIAKLQRMQDAFDAKNSGPSNPKMQVVDDNGRLMITQLTLQARADIVPVLTALVKSVREAIDSDQSTSKGDVRSVLIAHLTQVVADTKLACSTASSDLASLAPGVELLVEGLRAYLNGTPLPAGLTKTGATLGASNPQPAPKPTVAIKPAVASPLASPVPKTATPSSPFAVGGGVSATSNGPLRPVRTNSGAMDALANIVSKSPSPGPSPTTSAAMSKSQVAVAPRSTLLASTAATLPSVNELIKQTYSCVTTVSQQLKNNASATILADSVGALVSSVIKIIKETDSAGAALVDRYSLRETLVMHSTTAGKDVKTLVVSPSDAGIREALRVSVHGISNGIMSLLILNEAKSVFCAACNKSVDEDCILCEGQSSCGRWFHRPCVNLYSGSFKHTGWFCGIAPCKGKTFDNERQESERRLAKEAALQEREEEGRRIKEEKARWEREEQEKKLREENEARERKEREEIERVNALERLRNWEKESNKASSEFAEKDRLAHEMTGLSLSELEAVQRWHRKDSGQETDDPKAPKKDVLELLKKLETPDRRKSLDDSRTSLDSPGAPSGRYLSALELQNLQSVGSARAIEDYDTIGDESALNFKKGDIINVVVKSKDGWWEGELHGFYGTFYSTYVQFLGEDDLVSGDGQTTTSATVVDIRRQKSSQAPEHQKPSGGILDRSKPAKLLDKGHDIKVPKVTLGTLGDADYEGWLSVLIKKDWKQRWSIVKQFALYMFESKDPTSPAIGFVPLPSYTTTPAPETKRDHAFLLDHPSARSFYLAADNQRELDLWVDVLRRAAELRTFEDEVARAKSPGVAAILSPVPKTPSQPITPQSEPATGRGSSATPESSASPSLAANNDELPPPAKPARPSKTPHMVDEARPLSDGPPQKPTRKLGNPLSLTEQPQSPSSPPQKEFSNVQFSGGVKAGPPLKPIKPIPSTKSPVAVPVVAPVVAHDVAPVVELVVEPVVEPAASVAAVDPPIADPTGSGSATTTDGSAPEAAPEPSLRARGPPRLAQPQLQPSGPVLPAGPVPVMPQIASTVAVAVSSDEVSAEPNEDATLLSPSSAKGVPPPRPAAPPKNLNFLAQKSASSLSPTGQGSGGSSPSLSQPLPVAAAGEDESSDEETAPAPSRGPTGTTATTAMASSSSSKKKPAVKLAKAPVPNLILKQLDTPVLAGWLTKQGGSNKNWKKRYFVLKDFALYYFETNKWDAKALGVIPLPSYTVEEATKAETGKQFSFKAMHPSARAYYFTTESQDSMNKWLAAMRCASRAEIYTGDKIGP